MIIQLEGDKTISLTGYRLQINAYRGSMGVELDRAAIVKLAAALIATIEGTHKCGSSSSEQSS